MFRTKVSVWGKIFLSAALLLSLVTLTTFAAAPTHAAPNSTVTYEDTDLAVYLDRWWGLLDSNANGGAYRVSWDANQTARFKFSGTSISWVTLKCSDCGIAEVLIDVVSKGTYDLYSPSRQTNFPYVFAGLTDGKHKIVVKNTGLKNPASGATGVVVDAFTVGTTTTQEYSTKIKYDSWKGKSNANASGGSFRSSSHSGAPIAIVFCCTSINWVTAMGPSYGKAEVTIDSVSQGVVDLYSPTQQWQVWRSYSGLSNTYHTMYVIVKGKKNALSTGKKVVFDAFTVP